MVNKKKVGARASLVVIAVVVVPLLCCRMTPRYDVIVRNASDQSAHSVRVQFARFESVAWDLAAGDAVNEKLVPATLPETAVVTWETPAGNTRRVEVPVKAVAPPGLKEGDGIIFSLRVDGTVEVRFKVWRGMKAIEVAPQK